MKKAAMSILVGACLLASACGKKVLLSAKEAGNWKLVAVTDYTNHKERTSTESTGNMYILDGNGNFTYVTFFDGRKETGTYAINGGEVAFTYKGGTVKHPNSSFEGDTFVMGMENPAQVTLDSQRYQRVSDSDKEALLQKYNVK